MGTALETTAHVGYVDPAIAYQPFIFPSARATCVVCLEPLIAKCGEINRWHWAHEAGADFRCTGGDESAWHLAWKRHAELDLGARTEVVQGQHRADIVLVDGAVVELQSSYLDARDIAAREECYGATMSWIYRMTPGRFERLWNVGDGWFRWDRPAWSMLVHQRPVRWHHLDRLFDVTMALADNEFLVRFERGLPDRYGPVLYGSEAAPFAVGDAVRYLNDRGDR